MNNISFSAINKRQILQKLFEQDFLSYGLLLQKIFRSVLAGEKVTLTGKFFCVI